MATKPLALSVFKERITAVEEALKKKHRPPGVGGKGLAALAVAADSLGVNRTTFSNSINQAKQLHGLEPDWSLWQNPREVRGTIPHPDLRIEPDYHNIIRKMMLKGESTLIEMAEATHLTEALCGAIVTDLECAGSNVRKSDDGRRAMIEKTLQPAFVHGPQFEIMSDKDNKFRWGAISDTHCSSKYERLDVLNAEYDHFEAEGLERVYHCGNWIDGESRFNKHDIHIGGMDNQCRYLAEVYPKREGITTYAVTGDDHEGWYAQREGVDIGRYAENIMVDAGHKWVNLGFMEAYISLVNANTGKISIMAIVHPGGGVAYADSYSVQKTVEALEGGEKPAIAMYGHWHKMLQGTYRNVWWLMVPCCIDQYPHARKRKWSFVQGGVTVEATQDPETGAIIGFKTDQHRYFNRGYYQGRWSHHGSVILPERTL